MNVKHEYCNVVTKVSVERFNSFFSESFRAIRALKYLYQKFEEFDAGKLDTEDIEDELSDYVDQAINITEILVIGEGLTSVNTYRNKYLKSTCDMYKYLSETISELVEFGSAVKKHTVEILKVEVNKVIGGLTYFLINDFGLYNWDYSLDDSQFERDTTSVDEIVANYSLRTGISVPDIADELIQLSKQFKYKLDLFDEYQELEEPFEKIMGPSYYVIPEDLLTIEHVLAVVKGEMTPTDLLTLLEIEEDK